MVTAGELGPCSHGEEGSGNKMLPVSVLLLSVKLRSYQKQSHFRIFLIESCDSRGLLQTFKKYSTLQLKNCTFSPKAAYPLYSKINMALCGCSLFRPGKALEIPRLISRKVALPHPQSWSASGWKLAGEGELSSISW